MQTGIELREINIFDLLVLYDFNSLYPSAQIAIRSTWLKIETAYLFNKYVNDSSCSSFNSGRWNELGRSAFLTMNYHNLENLVFQHLPVKENRLDEINRIRKGKTRDTLTSVNTVEVVKYGRIIWEVFEGFFCHNVDRMLIQNLLLICLKKVICLINKEKISFKI